MPTLYRRARRRFYHAVARLVLATARAFPRRIGRACGRALALTALALRPRERELAAANLALALPDEDAAARRRRLRRAAARLGENLHDALTVDRRLDDPDGGVDGAEALARLAALRAEGRGVLVLTAHLGCWELLGGWLARTQGGLAVVVGEIRNAPVDRLVNDRRRALGLTPVPRSGDLRPLLRALRTGGVAAVLMDQATRVPSRPVPFFGRPAPTAVGFASLALRTGAPVLPLAIGRRGEGHAVMVGETIRPGDGRGREAEDALLARCNAALEDLVRRNPDEWVWFHRRWPDRPQEGGTP